MKLAEALLLRGDLKRKIASLRDRIVRNSLTQEGSVPHEDPNELLGEAFGVIKHFEQLVAQINGANLKSTLSDGTTLTAAMARRDALIDSHALLHAAIEATEKEPDRYSTREIKWVSTVDVAKLQRQAEGIAQQVRELNARIQETNWQVEL